MADARNEYSLSNKQSRKHGQSVNKVCTGASKSNLNGSTSIGRSHGPVDSRPNNLNINLDVRYNHVETETETADEQFAKTVKQDMKTHHESSIQEQCTSATGGTRDETETSAPSSKVSQEKVRRSETLEAGPITCHFCGKDLIFYVDVTKVSENRRITKQSINTMVSIGHCFPHKTFQLRKFLKDEYEYNENENSDDIKMDLRVIQSPMIRAITQKNIEQIVDYATSLPQQSRRISDVLDDILYDHWQTVPTKDSRTALHVSDNER